MNPDTRHLFEKSIDARFAEFDAAHPEVFELFRKLAHDLVCYKGFKKYSADAICHQIRWHYQVERGQHDFKMNNNFTSRFARKLMEEEPVFNGFFELRRLTA